MENQLNTPVPVETALKLGLSGEEYNKIEGYLGKKPNFTELSVYSVLWSEHCSYKNSILWLKKLPKNGKHVLAGAGEENAGLLDIGDGLAVCFKIESHNHPSAVEPYQGAATGVGGIHRDIFTMGARPIAALNSLRFGDYNLNKTQKLLAGVVKGIGDYGNSFGVPTVGGEVYFDHCYNTNPLVNAMSVGIVKHENVISAIAKGIGNPVFIVGSATGKDGIHGATFASKDISEDSAEELPAIQVGDPFQEKLLLEATQELILTGCIIGMQDMGAAGIACSTSEMSAKGGVGMDLWLDKVPTRQGNMLPFEILLSESQERMLVIVEKGKEDIIHSIFNKWDLPCVCIGTVTEGKNIRYFWHGELVGNIPAESLVLGGGAPVYERSFTEPKYFQNNLGKASLFTEKKANEIGRNLNFQEVADKILNHPNLKSKRWITSQYDSTVGAATLSNNYRTDAAVVHIKGTTKALAMTVDCNSKYVKNNPHDGCGLAVSEAMRNLITCGATPLGITNCLNFGNPYNPEVYWQFKEAILGMKDSCEKFNLPVTGGNVSFYNQSSDDGPVDPTPTIGMVGMIDNVLENIITFDFKTKGDLIYLLGKKGENVNSSIFAQIFISNDFENSPAPTLELEEEKKLLSFFSELTSHKLIKSAKDISEGGLFTTLVECVQASNFSCEITSHSTSEYCFYFSESGGRILVTISPETKVKFLEICTEHQLEMLYLGEVTDKKGNELLIGNQTIQFNFEGNAL